MIGTKISKKPLATLRQRKMVDGRMSLYLDIYHNGQRSYEALSLYILPETDKGAKRLNAFTLRQANKLCRQRCTQLKAQYKYEDKAVLPVEIPEEPPLTLVNWLDDFCKIQESRGIKDIKRHIDFLKRTVEIISPSIPLEKVDKEFCLKFISYLRNDYKKRNGEHVSEKTIQNLFGTFNTSLVVAVREGKIETNPALLLSSSDRAKPKPALRDFLTIDEVKKLIATPCKQPIVKNMVILPDGDVTICEELYHHPTFVIGNLSENSIRDVWQSKKALDLYYTPLQPHTKSTCGKCGEQTKCRTGQGVCWKSILMAYGKENWDFPDPRCPKAPFPFRKMYY